MTLAKNTADTPLTAEVKVSSHRPMVFGNVGFWMRSFLVLAILLTGIAIVFQVHAYRKSFTESQQLRVERKTLDTDWHKLLIEQQTFGATTQIGGRAVLTMGMYSPKNSEIITLNVLPSLNMNASESLSDANALTAPSNSTRSN